tara:strand:- start:2184 stop:2417 length:234 start_codon:yes stop_codon:yes gene_type:complete
MKNLEKKIFKIVSKSLGISEKKLTLKSSSNDFNEWDSLSAVRMLIMLNDEFNIKINVSSFDKLNSIMDIKKHIEKKL